MTTAHIPKKKKKRTKIKLQQGATGKILIKKKSVRNIEQEPTQPTSSPKKEHSQYFCAHPLTQAQM